MGKIINFKNRKQEYNTLDSWMKEQPRSTQEYKEVFLKLDSSMRNYHDNGYIIDQVHPENIHLVDNYIDFNQEHVFGFNRRTVEEKNAFDEQVRGNLWQASIIALNTYTNYDKWNLDFVRENFNNGISILFPEEHYRYYDRMFQKCPKVYLNDYVKAKKERDYNDLLKQEGTESSVGRSLTKNTGIKYSDEEIVSTPSSEDIAYKEAGFVKLILFPTAIILLSFLIPLIACLLSLK